MSYWRRWLDIVGWALLAALLAWNVTNAVPAQSRRMECFVVAFALALIGGALSYLETRRFLAIKICYAIVAGIVLRHFNIGFSRDGIAFLVFMAGGLFLISMLPPIPLGSRFRFRQWWPAMKRTVRRLRGGWREDEERFASETIGKRK
jgi:hypothetical protein